ncbi:HlyD family secretion protein [Pseudomonas sp. PD9R]|uniref:HlyD family secretion protein n=1 Tax=Pseudomonas sp. PD9R TaxID=2853534 RepID=UPI001C4954B6|nr:HlyD family efflux transporter periplasmic adaptor subunit [Pseudomonas sp. PD9R]MBV6824634.1 biotin/lipoyl-binding protein [Pseudomonas sp. PD9R]
MKIRFDSRKELSPTQEQGLSVLYAPGKRTAFRVRWYLILFLVASPLIWLGGKLAYGMLMIDAPAQLRLPILEVRARDAGRVEQLLVITGDQVRVDQPLVNLDNPEWRARLSQLAAMPTSPAKPAVNKLGGSERQLLRTRIGRAQEHIRVLEDLVLRGAVSPGEVLAAKSELDSFRADLLAFERREQLASQAPVSEQREVTQQNAEQQWLKTRLAALPVKAAQSGRVAEVLVNPGENVGAGTLLMRIERQEDPLLWIYLEPLNITYAGIGQPLRVRMPNGDWLNAHVVQAVDSAGRTPTVLRGPFAASEMGLQVAARFDRPLPARWRIDQLPLNVRFPTDWQQMLTDSREFMEQVGDFIAIDRATATAQESR